MMGRSSSFLCIWYPSRVCFHYTHQMTLPLQHIWVFSPQIFECTPITSIWPAQWFDSIFSSHVESNMGIMACHKCVSALHTLQVGQVRSYSYSLDNSRQNHVFPPHKNLPTFCHLPLTLVTILCCDESILLLDIRSVISVVKYILK